MRFSYRFEIAEMAWAYVIRSSDRESFKRCRRAWDLGSRERQNYEPIKPVRAFDFDRAIHDALAVYYFPGMWEWNREIVLPLALEGFFKSMRGQRDKYAEEHKMSCEEEREWNDHIEIGEDMLNRYFEWAPTVDRFFPIRVEPDFEVSIPDPNYPGDDLVAPGKMPIVPIRYRGRIDLLVVDGYDAYWIVEHRITEGAFKNIDQLLLDERGVSYCWAWENFFLGMKIAGVIYNELHKDISRQSKLADVNLSVGGGQDIQHESEPVAQHRRMYAQAVQGPSQLIKQHGNEFFRRTQIPRGRAEIENFGRQLALEAMDIANPEIKLYPNPSEENCSICAYLKPCIAMNDGSDVRAVLEASYRKRSDDEFEPGRLGGSTFSVDRGSIPPWLRRKD